jgi:vanillate/4-hydroxybenzoate decarboxylase subunit D
VSEPEVVCPRCGFDGIDTTARSPVPGVWTVLSCRQCTYLWRTTEPARTASRAAYPERYRWTTELVAQAPEVPPVASRAGSVA